jgi:hypothetical protein
MQLQFGQIKIPVSLEMNVGTIAVPGVQEFASLFSGALTLKIGNGSEVATMGKDN